MVALRAASFSLILLAGHALGQNVNEVEPNESKAAATPVVLTTAGNGTIGSINGVSTGDSTAAAGSATADYFKITVPAATPGIYRYELQFPSVSDFFAYTTSIRGLMVSSGAVQPGTDGELQRGEPESYAAPLQMGSVFYAFGSQAQVYYRVTGSSSTTAPYQINVVRSTVTPTVVPRTFKAGPITISTLNQTTAHTAFIVLDSNFAPVPTFQNDNATPAGGAPSSSIQSYCTRTLPAGTYYVALSVGAYETDVRVTADQPAPSDDGSQDNPVLDFPGVVLGANEYMILPPEPTNVTNVLIADGCQTIAVPTVSPDIAGLTFVRFTVGTPDTPCVAISTSPSPTMGMPGRFYATVTPGSPPNNTITGVAADLSMVGGSAAQPMYNDGVTGGDVAIDSIWTAQITLNNTPGNFPFSVTATDAGGRQTTNAANVNIGLVPPSNDMCTNPIVLSGLSVTPTSYFVHINLATDDGVTLPCQSTTYNGIWYAYTPPASCLLSFNGAPYMAVFNATPGCGGLGASLVCDFNRAEKTHIPLMGGTPYLIYMASDSSSSNPNDAFAPEFSISFPVTPPNDLCNSAIEVDLDDLPFADTLQIAGAQGGPYISSCVTDGSTSSVNDIWYHVVNGDSYCRMQVTLTGNTLYQSGTYYTGTCSALEEVYCPLGDGTFVMVPNTEYYIHFFTTMNPGPDPITISFVACNPVTHLPPSNDYCDQAIVIPDGLYPNVTPYTDSKFVMSAAADSIVIDCGSSRPRVYENNSIWYAYTPSQPVRALIKETSSADAAWAMFSGSCDNPTFMTCKTSDTSNNNTIDLAPCVTYYLCLFAERTNTNPQLALNLSFVTTSNGTADPCPTPCPADFNNDGARDVADLFAYINAWLAKTANADFNDSGNVDVADLFAYINAWLAGC